MDIAKLVALLGNSDQPLAEMYGIGNAKGRRLPLVQVPTTAGTGSEVTGISIITTGESEKKGVVSPLLLPDIALLDADLTLGLPRHVTRSEEHTSELQSLMRISYAVFCLKKKKNTQHKQNTEN